MNYQLGKTAFSNNVLQGMKNSNHIQSGSQKGFRIVIIDDHPLVRESLKKIIQHESDLIVCGEAEDRDQALARVASSKPHLAIVDLTLKNSYGLELIKDLCAQYPDVKILVLSMHDEMFHAERAVRAGARGYINKQETPTKIREAIRRVLEGEIYWSETAAARVASKVASPSRSSANFSLDLLTDRELQVFELIGAGRSTRQIATVLHIDISTVETYRARIKEKLSLKNAGELLQYAIRSTYGQISHSNGVKS